MSHDFPSKLKTFCENTRGTLGEPELLLRDHSLVGFYHLFGELGRWNASVRCLSQSSPGNLKIALGIISSGFRAHHPLKLCEECTRAQETELGFSYWVLQHQLPGVLTCPTHTRPLVEMQTKANGLARFQWSLPEARKSGVLLRSYEGARTEAAAEFSRFVSTAHHCFAGKPIQHSLLVLSFRDALRERMMLSDGGRLRMQAITQEYRTALDGFEHIQELSPLVPAQSALSTQLAKLFGNLDGHVHPLRYLAIAFWLFRGATPFELAIKAARYQGAKEEAASAPQVFEDRNTLLDSRVSKALEQGQSIRAIADSIGIDTATAMSVAARLSYVVKRRPKKLVHLLRERIVALLLEGHLVSEVAKLANVSSSTVAKLLSSTVGLAQDYKAAREQRLKDEYRTRWLDVVRSQLALSKKLLRTLDPAAFTWLYRHDRTWLHESMVHVVKAQPIRPYRIDWQARDDALHNCLQRAVAANLRGQPDRAYRMCDLYALVPDLRAKLAELQRLPRTAKLMEFLVTRPKHSREVISRKLAPILL